jgi:hypothetical protein
MPESIDRSAHLTKGEKEVVSTAVVRWFFNSVEERGKPFDLCDIHSDTGETEKLGHVLGRISREKCPDKKRGYLNRNFEKLESCALHLGEIIIRTNYHTSQIQKILFSESENLQNRIDLSMMAELTERDSRFFLEILRELPYPVDPIEKDLLGYITEEEVTGIDSRSYIIDTVRNSFLKEGYNSVPSGEAYKLLKPVVKKSYEECICNDRDLPQVLSDLRNLFKRERDFENYIEEKDFSFGIADVSDTVFRKRLDRVHEYVNELVEEDIVEKGKYLEIRDFPARCLRKVPVIDGKWIDIGIAAMIEFYETLEQEGYHIAPTADPHPLALPLVTDKDLMEPEDPEFLVNKRQEIISNIGQLHWDTRIIRGRKHIPFERFAEFFSRRTGQALSLRKGFKSSSLNKWMSSAETKNIPDGVEPFFTGLDAEKTVLAEFSVPEARKERKKREEMARRINPWALHSRRQKSYNPSGMGDGMYDRPFRGHNEPSRKFLADLRKDLISLFAKINGLQNALRRVSSEVFSGKEIISREMQEINDELNERSEELISDFNTIAGMGLHTRETDILIELCDKRDKFSWGNLFPDGFEIYPQNYENQVLSETEDTVKLFYSCSLHHREEEGIIENEMSGDFQRNEYGHNV